MQFLQKVNAPLILLFCNVFQILRHNATKKPPKTILGHFWSFLVIFAKREFFRINLAQSYKISHGYQTPCWVSEKTNRPIQREPLNRWMEGQTRVWKDEWKDGRVDRPKFIGPSWIWLGVKLENNFLSKLLWDTKDRYVWKIEPYWYFIQWNSFMI